MPTTTWTPNVRRLTDGEFVEASTMNPIISQLANRDQYLYERFAELGLRSVLTSYDIPCSDTDVQVGHVVYFDPTSGPNPTLRKASPGFTHSPGSSTYLPANQSYTFGIVKSINGAGTGRVAEVYMLGLVEQTNIIATLLQPGEILDSETGALYLSKTNPGKLTSVPGGLSIYVGYRLSNDKFFLDPNNEALNQFFFNYRFNLLDRPAGHPRWDGTTWTVEDVDTTKVGWIGAADPANPYSDPLLRPAWAKFWYQLPSDANIDADTSLTDAEKIEQKELKSALPPYPEEYSMLFLNGVYAKQYSDTQTDGLFLINQLGIWWAGDGNDEQPWSQDLVITATNVAQGVANLILGDDPNTLKSDRVLNLVTGDLVQIGSTTNQNPAGVLPNALYTFVHISDGLDYTVFSLKDEDGVDVVISSAGANVILEWSTTIWASYKGTDYLRARQGVHFIKINPDFNITAVTTLESNSQAISYVSSATGLQAHDGDLKTNFTLPITTAAPVASGTCISGLNWTSDALQVSVSPSVSSLVAGAGIALTTDATGSVIVSTSSANLWGAITEIEPENSRLEFSGLHSYTNLTSPGIANGFIAKFQLPAVQLSSNLNIYMLMFGKTTSSSNPLFGFTFQYAVSSEGVLAGTTSVNSGNAITIALPNPYTVANTAFVGSNPQLSIPASALKPNGFVNFRITRTATPYTGDIGILGLYWRTS